MASLTSRWTGERLLVPSGFDPKGATDKMCIAETTILLLPGGLPSYWQACEAHRPQLGALSDGRLLAELVALVGRLHRIVRYEIFQNSTEAMDLLQAQAANSGWQAFEREWSEWIADRNVSLLRLSPLASRRALLSSG